MKGRLSLLLVLVANTSFAHPLAFGRLELREEPSGLLRVTWRFSGTAAHLATLRVVLPSHCAPIGASWSEPIEDGIERITRYRCDGTFADAPLRVDGLDGSEGHVVLRYLPRHGPPADGVLNASTPTWQLRHPTASVWTRYLVLGVEHIATGWDHLAFVLALSLLVHGNRALLAAVTGFTLGHSITLALAALGVVQVPTRPVEAAIAWSVVVVARAALVDVREAPGRVPPWALAVAFGLLHGFGFAGALGETGLAPGAVARSLLAFNLGVEFGQLVFVALLLSIAHLAHRAGVDRATGRRLAATLAGIVGAYGSLERAWQLVP